MFAQDGAFESSAIGGWSRALGELHRRIGHRFARSEARERVKRYLAGLLGRVERKNGWQLAEAIGERDPQGVQRLLNSAEWDADEVRDDLREYVLEHLGDEETGVLIVDETGFLKKGEKSVGVARQYTGTAGTRSTAKLGCFWPTPREGRRIPRPGALPAQGMDDELPRQEGGGRRPREDRLPQQSPIGRDYAGAGLRGRRFREITVAADCSTVARTPFAGGWRSAPGPTR